MRRMIYTMLFGTIATLVSFGVMPTKVQAAPDEYWDGYWTWYDRDYSPYYARRYRAPPPRPYRAESRPYYREDGYFYDNPRYGSGRVYYRDYGPRAGVNVGPVRVRWY